jgi:hypothetical protein
MVFDLKNMCMHKRTSLMLVTTILAFIAFSGFLMQLISVGAQTSGANFTGIIYDSGVDTDGDGTFNFLQIGVEVDVSVAGTYQVDVTGLYYTPDVENYIDISDLNTTFLNEGVQVVYLSLDDSIIYSSGINPTYVAVITLLDEEDNVLDNLYDLPLSKTYVYTDFDYETEIRVDAIEREITLHSGNIHVVNSFTITNIGDRITSLDFGIPQDAKDITFWDEMGNLDVIESSGAITVNLRNVLKADEVKSLYLSYNIPWESYVIQQNGLNYNLDFTFYEQFNWTIGELIVSVILPEGASFQSSTPINPSNVERSGLQDTVTFTLSDVTPSDNLNFSLNYRYLIFWSSFFPTIWVGILVAVVTVFAFLWKVPTPVSTPMITVPPEDLRMFVNAYEEKERIQSELKSMEKRLQKHKIPRRRYKVRKKMMDGRLATMSKDLAFHREKIRSAGSKYANMMRQIEVAETNLEGAERDIQRAKARYRRGEVSKDAYGKLMDEYTRRSEEAEATIDGIILRLREEIP